MTVQLCGDLYIPNVILFYSYIFLFFQDDEGDVDFVVPKSNERRDRRSRKAEERRRQREREREQQQHAKKGQQEEVSKVQHDIPTNIASVNLVMGCSERGFFFSFTFLYHLPWRTYH